MEFKYPVYSPILKGNEKKYVNDCLDSTWISSKGKYIGLFEQEFARFVNIRHASSVSNGTTALHLALLAIDIKPGDEIIAPTITFVATANAIKYVGGKPVFVDALRSDWQMNPKEIERKITSKTRAVIVVHLYGHPCDIDTIKEICVRHKLILIEDCAEAIGSYYKNIHVGTFGDISTFSFYGNKTITTGEGGMVISNSKELIDKVNHLKDQAMTKIQYWHDVVGYNYRMTNICAAIGLAQLECIDEILRNKIQIANAYREIFKNSEVEFHVQSKDVVHSYWMCSILIKSAELRDPLRRFLSEYGVDSRPMFYPIHTLPVFTEFSEGAFPVAEDICSRGLNLPSYPTLNEDDITYIGNKVLEFLNNE
jgi:perosamine synthetase